MSWFGIRPRSDPLQQVVDKNQQLLKSEGRGREKDLYFIFDEKTGEIKKGSASDGPQGEVQLAWKDKTVHLIAKRDGNLSSLGQIALKTSLIAVGVSGKDIPEALRETPISPEETFAYVQEILESPHPIDRKAAMRLYQLLYEGPIGEISIQQTDPSHPAVIVKHLVEVFQSVADNPKKAIQKTGIKVGEEFAGMNGSYYLKDLLGNTRFVFKPEAEEYWNPLSHLGYPLGGGAKREQLAYIFARRQGANVPPTLYVEIEGKVGSLQAFVSNATPASYLNASQNKKTLSRISYPELQNLAFLHGGSNNQDVHLGNVLAVEQSDGTYLLYGIDNGYSFGERPLENKVSIDYYHFPQMHAEIDPIVARKILSINAQADAELMRRHGFSEVSIAWRTHSVLFQQEAIKKSQQLEARGKRGLTPFEILKLQSHSLPLLPIGSAGNRKFLIDSFVQIREAHLISKANGHEALTKLTAKTADRQRQEALGMLYTRSII
jgi:hypothetical protein